MATVSNVNFSLVIENNPYATDEAKNATYYYNTQGDATAEYFLTANIGTVTASNGFANVNLTANLDALGPSESKAFSIKIRKNSHTGPVIATSNTINIVGEDILYTQATGGNTVVSGGYKIHEFRSSANLIVTSVAAPVNNQVDYVIVAGGGGGGAVFGGGGGAGGMLTGTGSSSIITQAGNLLVIVGAGGNKTTTASSGYPPATLGTRGGNSQLGSFIAVGGGVGRTYDDRTPTPAGLVSGGSGGGGAYQGRLAGNGIPGQGNPGSGETPGSLGGGGGGAGGSGNSTVPSSTGATGGVGLPITWATPFIGTPGPTSGRWFSGGGGGGHNNGSGPPYGGEGGAGGGGPGGPVAGPGTIYTGGGGGGGSFVNGNESGNGGSGAVAIRYPFKSTTVNYTVNSAGSQILANSSMTYAIVTNGLTANARFYYTLTGNVTSADIDTPLSGSFIVSDNRANVEISVNAAATLGSVFGFQLRRLSTNGKILATGNTITISPITYIQATGGIITDSGRYRIHTFNNSGNLVVSTLGAVSSLNNIDYLVVGGGGGGASGSGGGGGAGGYVSNTRILTSTGNLLVVIGGGGAGGVHPGYNPGSQGVNSQFAGDISIGGGAGGAYNPGASQGYPGGSGGGGAISSWYGGTATNYPGPVQQGYPGGYGQPHGSGGGGAGEAGNTDGVGAGGDGLESSISGTATYYAGGGGGGAANNSNNPLAVGGEGGGGRGGPGVDSNVPGVSGNVNTGGGGGGGGLWQGIIFNSGGTGGSGIVIIRYPYQ